MQYAWARAPLNGLQFRALFPGSLRQRATAIAKCAGSTIWVFRPGTANVRKCIMGFKLAKWSEPSCHQARKRGCMWDVSLCVLLALLISPPEPGVSRVFPLAIVSRFREWMGIVISTERKERAIPPRHKCAGPLGVEQVRDAMSANSKEIQDGASRETGNVMLELSAVTKRFGGLAAVEDVNLQINKGEIISVIGPNGAGKTTVFNLITG